MNAKIRTACVAFILSASVATVGAAIFIPVLPVNPDAPASPALTASQRPSVPYECQALAKLPAYDVKQSDGTLVHTPNGRALVNETRADHPTYAELRTACLLNLAGYVDAHTN